MSEDHRRPVHEVRSLLASIHPDAVIDQLEAIRGGFWSSAYRYDADGEGFVLRLGADDLGYRMDRTAATFSRPELPVPEVLDIGEAFGGHYAVSRRFEGRFLEEVDDSDLDTIGATLERLLAGLRSVDIHAPGTDWFTATDPTSNPSPETGWRAWIGSVRVDDPASPVAGWSTRLQAHSEAHALFEEATGRIDELLPHCPERRDLVHADLLHQNVLISEDASTVNAVFSWKCSMLGDHLYDVALCTFWQPWHPTIAATDPLARVIAAGVEDDDLADAALRHHCYELHIGAHHLAWNAWTGDTDSLDGVARRTAAVLARGPHP